MGRRGGCLVNVVGEVGSCVESMGNRVTWTRDLAQYFELDAKVNGCGSLLRNLQRLCPIFKATRAYTPGANWTPLDKAPDPLTDKSKKSTLNSCNAERILALAS